MNSTSTRGERPQHKRLLVTIIYLVAVLMSVGSAPLLSAQPLNGPGGDRGFDPFGSARAPSQQSTLSSDVLVLRSLKAVHKLSAELAVFGRRSPRDPRLGPPIELGSGHPSGLIQIGGPTEILPS
jgi:hypothetical protein